ncbi:hypothetical protein [Halohasta salina]|uniref:hypothetical protein n=1 Tax=Halohasta salina TaxID=2961621 RepID=UPI0020A5C1B1|nr:hypothetical protein [Halohasta salina]
MNGKIIDEDDRGIGVRVTDNNQVNHTVAVGFDGTIQGHSQDGYHDEAAKRTHDDNERVEQARRFARYYVFQERGYDTLRPLKKPRPPLVFS